MSLNQIFVAHCLAMASSPGMRVLRTDTVCLPSDSPRKLSTAERCSACSRCGWVRSSLVCQRGTCLCKVPAVPMACFARHWKTGVVEICSIAAREDLEFDSKLPCAAKPQWHVATDFLQRSSYGLFSRGLFWKTAPPNPPKNFSRPSVARPARGVGGSAHRRSVSAEHIFVRMPAFLRKPPASGQGVSCCDGVLRTPSRNESFPGGLGGRLSKRPPRTIERNSGLEEAAKWPASKCTRIVLVMKKVFNEPLRMGWKRTLHSIS